MREDLRRYVEKTYWVYGVSEEDFEHTIALARSFVAATFELVRQEWDRQRASNPEQADDIMDDIAAHTGINADYVWHACLWRLQGLLEAMIVCTFLRKTNSTGLVGLKAKLQAMRDAGFKIADGDWNELLQWARVRNALSHAPPEQYRPGPLRDADVDEYHQLALRLCNEWRSHLAETEPGAAGR